MEVLFLILALVGVIASLLAIGFASDEGPGWPQIILGGVAATLMAGSILSFYKSLHMDNVNLHNSHVKALRDLRQHGWNVESKDIHIQSGKVDLGCLKLHFKKFGTSTYQVAIKRDKHLGGGYTILKPQSQSALTNLCFQNPDTTIELETKTGNAVATATIKKGK